MWTVRKFGPRLSVSSIKMLKSKMGQEVEEMGFVTSKNPTMSSRYSKAHLHYQYDYRNNCEVSLKHLFLRLMGN